MKLPAAVEAVVGKLAKLFRRRKEPLIYRYLREEERRYRRETRGRLKYDEKWFKPSWRDREAWRLARSCKDPKECYPAIRFIAYRYGKEAFQFLQKLAEKDVDLDAVVRLVEKYGASDRRVEDCIKLGLCEEA
ncbi:MAG: hypothetical protein QXP98_00480 [Thermoproteus sp.]